MSRRHDDFGPTSLTINQQYFCFSDFIEVEKTKRNHKSSAEHFIFKGACVKANWLVTGIVPQLVKTYVQYVLWLLRTAAHKQKYFKQYKLSFKEMCPELLPLEQYLYLNAQILRVYIYPRYSLWHVCFFPITNVKYSTFSVKTKHQSVKSIQHLILTDDNTFASQHCVTDILINCYSV